MLTPAIRNIIIVCTSVFLLQTLLKLFFPLSVTIWFLSEFGLVPLAVTHGLRFWQPLTYLFLHDGIASTFIFSRPESGRAVSTSW
jgi:membrane associated rhomboid family serine protease